MPIVGVLIEDQPIPWSAVTPDILPPELVTTMAKPRPGRPEVLHLTDLTVCPHCVARGKLCDLYLPLKSIYRMAKGKAMDSLCLMNRRGGAYYQFSLNAHLEGVEVVGTPDIIDFARGTIEDYKCPDRMYTKTPPGYTYQLNGYNWLYSQWWDRAGIPITNLYLNACGPAGYRQIEVALWPLENTRDFLTKRLARLQEVLRERAVECADRACIYCRGRVHREAIAGG